jgi:hypothetical protein
VRMLATESGTAQFAGLCGARSRAARAGDLSQGSEGFFKARL